MSLHAVLSTRYPSADQLMSFQRALSHSLDLTGESALSVRVDVREDEKAFHVSADLPGLSEKEIKVSFDEGLLTLSGEKKLERDEKQGTWHIAERSSGSFVRKLKLKTPIDVAKIEATFEKGVLTVTLPKQAKDDSQTRKIEIKTA